jgi:hypothetical protein
MEVAVERLYRETQRVSGVVGSGIVALMNA